MVRFQSSAIHTLQIFLMVLIAGFFWRYFSARYAHTAFGKAMAYLY